MLESLVTKVVDIKKIKKPWGHEVIWGKSKGADGYAGKLLYIKAGHRLSLQFHEKKEETILVRSGNLYVETLGFYNKGLLATPVTMKLSPGEVIHIPRFLTHRFSAKDSDVELVEISTNHLDDVVRLKDDYGR